MQTQRCVDAEVAKLEGQGDVNVFGLDSSVPSKGVYLNHYLQLKYQEFTAPGMLPINIVV